MDTSVLSSLLLFPWWGFGLGKPRPDLTNAVGNRLLREALVAVAKGGRHLLTGRKTGDTVTLEPIGVAVVQCGG